MSNLRKENLNLIRNKANILLDIDTHKGNPIRKINYRYKWIAYYFKDLLPAKFIVYRTRKGYHFYIYCAAYDKVAMPEIPAVYVQALLGSDWLRETRNFYRILQGFADWNILFSVKNGKKVYKEKFYCAYTIKKNRVR